MRGPVVPDRVRWAVEVLDPRPGQRILEAGCGPGAAAELICPRLAGGRMLALDRSAVAVRRTTERNAGHVASGALVVRRADLAELTDTDAPPGSLDAAFTVNVNLFWTRDPGPELTVLRRALRPGGLLHVLYGGAPPGGTGRVLSAVRDALRTHGFDVRDVSGDGVGVSARTPAG